MGAAAAVLRDLEYGTAIDVFGAPVSLQLDLYVPPAGGPASRPLVVLAHGGGFRTGDRDAMETTARGYARRGYVAAAIGYRLDPDSDATPERYLAAATNGIDDGMEAVRWLRDHAPDYANHYDVDTVTGFTAEYARLTGDLQVLAGSSCRFVRQPGPGHTTTISAGGTHWGGEVGPLLWDRPDLWSII